MMQSDALPENEFQKSDSLVEWAKVICLLAGIGTVPLLAQLPWDWLRPWYWVIEMASGVFLVGLGAVYWIRSLRRARARAAAHNLERLLAEARFERREIKVVMRLDPPAAAHQEMLDGLVELHARLQAGLISAQEFERLKASQQAAAASQSQQEVDDDFRQAMTLIPIGVFILLPAVAAALMQSVDLANAPLVTAYLGAPALGIWATFEVLRFRSYWGQRAKDPQARQGLARSTAQIAASWLIWNYLGLEYATGWAASLFWLGVLLALASPVLPSALWQAAPAAPAAAPEGSPEQELPEEAGPDTEPAPAGEFLVFLGKDEQFYFHLSSETGQVLLVSEGYTTLNGCLGGVRAVRKNAAIPERFTIYPAKNGGFYFMLKAANYRLVGVSDVFADRLACEASLALVARLAGAAALNQRGLPARSKAGSPGGGR